jgi:hypothetical protein
VLSGAEADFAVAGYFGAEGRNSCAARHIIKVFGAQTGGLYSAGFDGCFRPIVLKNSAGFPRFAQTSDGGALDDGKPGRRAGATVLLFQP